MPSTAPGAVSVEALTALRALDAYHPAPAVLGYHPVDHTNPFQRLLYQRAWEAGIAPVPVPENARFDELAQLAHLGHRVGLHLHWLNRPLARATTEDEAAAAAQPFLDRLDRLRASGVQLVWTVHNILPHEARFETLEAWFRGEVAARMDVIHVMAGTTARLVAPHFTLPADRVLRVPHPAYAGAYPDHLSQAQARHELGIAPDELVYLMLGGIRRYKGIDQLLDAWDDLPSDGKPRRLLVAGRPSGGPEIGAVLARATLHPNVLIQAGRIEIDAMQVYLRAADVVVLPYVRTLNSGALMLAFTFGLPAIVPDNSGIAELVDGRNGFTFPTDDRSGLVDALVRAGDLATPAARAAAVATARSFDASTLSAAFASGLRGRLGWG